MADTFWTSTLAVVLVSLACALPFGAVFAALVRRRKRTVTERLASFVSMPQPGEGGGGVAALRGQLLTGAQKSLDQTRWWPRLKEELDIAGVEMPAIQLLAWTVIGTLLAMFLLYLAAPPLSLLALGVPFGARAALKRKLEHQRHLFAEQLAENCEITASAMRAGHSFLGALSLVVEEAAEPSRGEFARVVADEQLGVPLEKCLTTVARRMANADLPQMAMVASLQQETGGNTAEVLDRVAEGIRARLDVRRMIETLTAQGRLTRWIVSALPVALLGIITFINPGYVSPLYSETTGHLLLAVAASLLVAGSLVIKRIVDIKA